MQHVDAEGRGQRDDAAFGDARDPRHVALDDREGVAVPPQDRAVRALHDGAVGGEDHRLARPVSGRAAPQGAEGVQVGSLDARHRARIRAVVVAQHHRGRALRCRSHEEPRHVAVGPAERLHAREPRAVAGQRGDRGVEEGRGIRHGRELQAQRREEPLPVDVERQHPALLDEERVGREHPVSGGSRLLGSSTGGIRGRRRPSGRGPPEDRLGTHTLEARRPPGALRTPGGRACTSATRAPPRRSSAAGWAAGTTRRTCSWRSSPRSPPATSPGSMTRRGRGGATSPRPPRP
ncbi:hypothetical protein CMMCA001_12575 [Clavibacter michiganensis subsp. michiganensis]|nr:hypothetical protein CMMCA001_12575 [Clavibacter michiganensis subsp. michiganensis]